MEIINLYADSSNYGSRREISTIKYIVIHYTGNNNDRAISNCKYFQSPNRSASAHYFVDETSIYRSVSDDIVAWAVGGNKYNHANITGGGRYHGVCTNNNSISIEMCNSVNSIPDKTKENVKWLVQELMNRYTINENNIIRHFDVTGKACPLSLLDEHKWNDFREYLIKLDTLIATTIPSHSQYITSQVKVDLFGEIIMADSININNFNHVKLRDLDNGKEINVGWDGKNVLINNKVFDTTESILYQNINYVKIRSLQEQGIVSEIVWNGNTQTIIVR